MSKVVVLPTAVWLALAGAAFTLRCELSPTLPGGWPTCWVIGGSVAGVPFFKRLAEKSGFVEGYNTYNPALRRKEEESNPSQAIIATNTIL